MSSLDAEEQASGESPKAKSTARRVRGIIAAITLPRRSGLITLIAIVVTYGGSSLLAAPLAPAPEFNLQLVGLVLLATPFFWLGYKSRLFDQRLRQKGVFISVPIGTFCLAIWLPFVLFTLMLMATADNIPLMAALQGADAESVAIYREQFLKARTGWQSSFVYIHAIFSAVLVPYTVPLMFLRKVPGRRFALLFFFFYAISFVEKAFFLRALLPIMLLVAHKHIRFLIGPKQMVMIVVAVFVFLATSAGLDSLQPSNIASSFFEIGYVPTGSGAYLIWRAFAIPMLTAVDALRAFEEVFQGEYLLGATSSALAALTGLERIAFEREVFAFQWGQNETGTGSANSVYIIEAFVNFGYAGVVIFSFLAGLMMRMFWKSEDHAFQATWPLFALGLYTSGLIGLILSNGYLLMFAIILSIRLKSPEKRRIHNAPHSR